LSLAVISTERRIEYALGYIELGMLNEASDELEAVLFDERFTVPVSRARVELHMAAKHWDIVVGYASRVVDSNPEMHDAWIAWAYALRELNRVAEALAVLKRGVLLHGETYAVFHYNLACYHCLLGDLEPARICLRLACKKDAEFKAGAVADPDLRAMWDELNAPN
jgi:tetratricopeptide (TPR) repeat protein